MRETLTRDAIQYALAAHLTARHATSLQIDVGCPECLALMRAVQAAEAVVPAPDLEVRR